MTILEILTLFIVLMFLLLVKLMPLLLVFLVVSCLATPFIVVYESKLPNLKMAADQEIPVEQVTFEPRNILKELEERSL